jgi:hypothetical protein
MTVRFIGDRAGAFGILTSASAAYVADLPAPSLGKAVNGSAAGKNVKRADSVPGERENRSFEGAR